MSAQAVKFYPNIHSEFRKFNFWTQWKTEKRKKLQKNEIFIRQLLLFNVCVFVSLRINKDSGYIEKINAVKCKQINPE